MLEEYQARFFGKQMEAEVKQLMRLTISHGLEDIILDESESRKEKRAKDRKVADRQGKERQIRLKDGWPGPKHAGQGRTGLGWAGFLSRVFCLLLALLAAQTKVSMMCVSGCSDAQL